VHPLVELDVGVGGSTIPPAGRIAAVAVPTLAPGPHSVLNPNVCAVGEISRKSGVPVNAKYRKVYGWMVTSYPAAFITDAT
jgi:hypothetical protein